MSVTAYGPDGSTFSFPDGTPQEVVRSTLGKHYGWPDAPPAAPARMPRFKVQGPDGNLYNVEAPDMETAVTALHGLGQTPASTPDAAPASGDIDHSWPARLADNMRSVADGATLGASPRIAAALEAATGIGGDFGDYSGNLARRQDTERAYAQAHPVLSGIGNLTGNVAGLAAVGAVPGVAAALPDAAPTILGKIGQGAAAGAGLGAVQGANEAPDWSNVGQTVNSTVQGAGAGAILGGGFPLVAKGVGKSLSALADARGDLARPSPSRPGAFSRRRSGRLNLARWKRKPRRSALTRRCWIRPPRCFARGRARPATLRKRKTSWRRRSASAKPRRRGGLPRT